MARKLGPRSKARLEKTDKAWLKLASGFVCRQTALVLASVVHRPNIGPSAPSQSAISALLAFRWDQDGPGVLIPHIENHFIVRLGPLVPRGIEVHAFGARQKVHRKFIRSGHQSVTVRLRLGASDAVLGVPASEISGQIVAIEDLWGDGATRRLYSQLSEARDTSAVAVVLEKAIAERHANARQRSGQTQLALAAADKLLKTNVNLAAMDLGVSERHLRRVFQETMGVGPKAFTKLARFHHALRAARAEERPSWANIAAVAGYYDQAHLIADFRSIAGVTPRAFVGELRATRQVG